MDYKKLDEIATDFRYGKMPDKSRLKDNGLYPVWSGYRYVGFYDEKNVNKNEIVVVARGVGGTGDVKIAVEDCYLTNLSIAFTVNEDINPLYIYYFYKIKNLRYLDSGSAQSQITINDLKNVIIPIPSKKKQDKIVELLNKIDKKIELNNKINNNLHELINSLYKELFNTLDDNNSSLIQLKEISKSILGGTPSRANPEYWNGNINWINSGEINKFRILTASEKITEEGLNKSSATMLPKKTTVIAITGATLGQVSRLEIESCANQSVIGIVPFDEKLNNYIYLYILNNIKDLILNQTGGAQQHINKNNVETFKIRIPKEEQIEMFNNKVNSMFEKIRLNCLININLEQLRNTLLPKLMNGEIELDNIEI